jgi:two-component system heavy metal sensor histidine kinase CusS
MKFNSLRFKASVLYSAILAVILITFSLVMFFVTQNILYKNLDQELKIKAEEIAGILNAYKQVQNTAEHPLGQILMLLGDDATRTNQKMIVDELWRSQLDVLNLKNDFINILNVQGQTVLNSNNFKENIAVLFKEQFPFKFNSIVYKSLKSEQHQLRAINLPIKFRKYILIIQVGTSVQSINGVLNKMLIFMFATVTILLFLTSFVGRIFVEHALRPVKEVSDMANNISHKDLNQRIKEKRIDAEMKQLVSSFNSMISRLARSFGHINEFSSHAAHELKTPLAIMRGEIEVALEENKTNTEYKKVLEGCLEEIDSMVKVIKDLLLLAKLDYNPDFFRFEKLLLLPFLDEIFEHSKVLAETKKITLTKYYPQENSNIVITADKSHLRRLFFNIISNAVKFTPFYGKIDINVFLRKGKCCVDIADTGEGISEQNLNRIFDKFFRVRKSHEKAESGVGLGLNIALSIARAHNGEIQAQSKLHQGTTFSIILPVA